MADSEMVQSPSVGSSNALARFEYEAGRTRDCTKVLMVEWEDDDTTRHIAGEWSVGWEKKSTVLSARDTSTKGVNRLYFLLAANDRVPGTVHLVLTPTNKGAPVIWKANPLPAIFPPELGASAREAGKKGVLHTIWAKRRLQVLAKEIEQESSSNTEGIALTMAIQEKEWIEHNFGVHTKPPSVSLLNSPTSPRSPGGSRLMDKLKGLKLDTRVNEEETDLSDNLNPLSPEQSDVAVSSFGSFAELKGMPGLNELAAKPPQRQIKQQSPPEAVLMQQRKAGHASLNAMAVGQAGVLHDDDREDDLFALPISPRSPDMSKSPFTFTAADTRRYVGDAAADTAL